MRKTSIFANGHTSFGKAKSVCMARISGTGMQAEDEFHANELEKVASAGKKPIEELPAGADEDRGALYVADPEISASLSTPEVNITTGERSPDETVKETEGP